MLHKYRFLCYFLSTVLLEKLKGKIKSLLDSRPPPLRIPGHATGIQIYIIKNILNRR